MFASFNIISTYNNTNNLNDILTATITHYEPPLTTKNPHNHPPTIQVNKAKETLYKYQEDLEREHRQEEEKLIDEIDKENRAAVQSMEKEFDEEWEQELKEIAKHYEKKEKQMVGVCISVSLKFNCFNKIVG